MDNSISISLGNGNEFGVSDSSMFIRQTLPCAYGEDVAVIIDLGAPTLNEFNALISLMQRLRCHMKDK